MKIIGIFLFDGMWTLASTGSPSPEPDSAGN